MNERDYAAFIVSAYGISGLVLAALGAWIFLDARLRRRELARLEESGIRRRATGGKA